jgi:hypothetical protein
VWEPVLSEEYNFLVDVGGGGGNTANTTVKHMAPIRGKESSDLFFWKASFNRKIQANYSRYLYDESCEVFDA